MNTRVKSTAILLALILTLSVFTSLATTTAVAAATTTPTVEAAKTTIAATPTVAATPTAAATATPNVVAVTGTILTITASPANPGVKQTVYFTVTLKTGSTGLSKPVKLWCTVNGVRVNRGTFNTVNGIYTFSGPFSSKGQIIYHAEFAGDSQFGASAGTVTVNVGLKATATTISASSTNPPVGQTVTFYVGLWAGTTRLSKPMKIWHTLKGVRYEDGTHNTVNGVYSFKQAFGSTGERVYRAEFVGDTSYGPSRGIVAIHVGTSSTTLTATAPASATPNTAFTIDGYLKTSSGAAIANQPVKLYYAWNDNEGWLGPWRTVYTEATGHWSASDSDTEPIHYKAVYDGSTTYTGSTAYTGWVGIKASTTLTATAPTKASPNTAFAISGDLTTTTRHHALGNQRVDLWYAYNDNTGYHWFKTVYTDATGHWSTTDKDTQSIHYKAAYDGATWYDASTAYTGWVGIA